MCIGCGYAGHADHVAAINIAVRADVNRPIVSEDFFEIPLAFRDKPPNSLGGN